MEPTSSNANDDASQVGEHVSAESDNNDALQVGEHASAESTDKKWMRGQTELWHHVY